MSAYGKIGTALFASAAISAYVVAVPAHAQETRAGSGGFDDIVVTARRSAESLMTVPVAVTAMSAQDINRYAANDLVRIAQLNPQVEFQKGGSGAGATFLIRGIGSSAADPGLEQTVSVNIDGVLVSRGRILDQGMFDLQQVEILKGPQALFFGKNSPAGVVSITSANPTDQLEGYVRAGYEFEAKERFIEGAISGPITDTLKVRLAGRAHKMDGWIKNTATPRPWPADPSILTPGAWDKWSPASESISGRLTVVFEPTSNFTSTLKVLAGERKENGDTHNEAVCAPGIEHPSSLGMIDEQNDCELNRERASSGKPPEQVANSTNPDGVPFSKQTNILVSWNNQLNLGLMDLTAVTGYTRLDKKGRDDSGATSFGMPGGGADELTESFSQEVRLNSVLDGPLNFTIGAFFEDMTREQFAELNLAYLPVDPATGRRLTSQKGAHAKSKTWSAFGQVRWNILENLELAGGARWTREEKSAVQNNIYAHPDVAYLMPSHVVLSSRYTGENVSPEATLTWNPTYDLTVYGAYKTGYKSGGIANPLILTLADSADAVVFGSEKAKGGEVGVKGYLFDRTLRFELVGYRYTFKGLQTSSFDNQFLRYILRNAASARTTGVEASADWRPTQELSLRGAVGYNRAKFLDFPGAPCYAGQSEAEGCVGGQQDLSGEQLYRAPKFSASMGAGYDRPLNNDLMFGVNVDARYTSSYVAQENYNPVSRQGSYWLLNAGARVYAQDDQWELAFIGRNLTNTNYMGFSTDKPGGGPGEIGVIGSRSRELMLQGTFRF